MDESEVTQAIELPQEAGPRLRAAREAKGLSLEQVAAQTRIPQRHLATIEEGAFSDLPGRTYAVGFARTYAKTVGLDPDEIVAMVRAELDQQLGDDHYHPATTFEPGDPARVPSRGLGWLAVLALVLLIAGGFFFFRAMFFPAAELPSLIGPDDAAMPPAQQAVTQAAANQPVPTGPVVFTATDEAWVRFYTSEGTVAEMLMAPGDSYTLPADASGLMLRTGRPDALRITVGGREVPRLAEEQTVISDVPVTAEALLARPKPSLAPAVQPAGENSAVPAT